MSTSFGRLICTVFVTKTLAHDALLDLIPSHIRGGNLWQRKLEQIKTASVYTNSTPNYFPQPIDYSEGEIDVPMFNQRWYVDYSYCSEYDRNSCPMFLYIGGEGTLSGTPGGYVSTIAQEQGALLFALEHRWYGDSLPGDITSTDDLKSLTVQNAIMDLARFQSYQERITGSEDARKWVLVGGSYPGALATWYRVQYPYTVSALASWSSSGVILAVDKFTQFDQIEATVVGDDCAQALRDVTSAFETAWDAGGDTKQNLLDLFGTPDDFTKADMAWMLADAAAMGPQYGYKTDMCAYLVPEPEEGVLVAFANWTNFHYGPSFGSSCYYSTACLSNPNRVTEWYDTKSWVWQCCHELEYWQVAYPNSLRSQVITKRYFEKQCEHAFGKDYPAANVDEFNAYYGGLEPPNVTQVIATNGLDDPWRGATQNLTVSDDYPENTADCDDCGHCGDLHTLTDDSSAALYEQQDLIRQYIDSWIAGGF